jgi:leucyl aminopeptidase
MHIHFQKNKNKIGSILERSVDYTIISLHNEPLTKLNIVYLMNLIFKEDDYTNYSDIYIDLLDVSLELLDVQIKAFFHFNNKPLSYKKNKILKPNFYLNKDKVSKNILELIDKNSIIMDFFNETKSIIDTPSDIMYPQKLIEYVIEFSEKNNLTVLETYDEIRLNKDGLHGILTVGKGSIHKPRMIILQYDGTNGNETRPVVLVGKGVTYDSGGYSLKRDSKNMKQDKTGALIILALMGAISNLKLKCKVIGILPFAENVISSNSYKPDDVIISHNKLSVEVYNTDAEGRLLLMDGLSLAYKEYNPKIVIDIATLTGVSIFCNKMGAIFSNNIELAWEIQKMGEKHGDPFWVLPILDSFMKDTQDNDDLTDVKNEGFSCHSGTVMAAAFLKNFVDDSIPWIHMDIGDSKSLYEHFDSNNRSKINSFLTIFYFLETFSRCNLLEVTSKCS